MIDRKRCSIMGCGRPIDQHPKCPFCKRPKCPDVGILKAPKHKCTSETA